MRSRSKKSKMLSCLFAILIVYEILSILYSNFKNNLFVTYQMQQINFTLECKLEDLFVRKCEKTVCPDVIQLTSKQNT
jgi:hypothetical protein